MLSPVKVAVLVSGGGTNLQAILDAEKAGKIKSGQVSLVVSNNSKAYALERAKNFGVEAAVLLKKDYADAQAWEKALISLLEEKGIELIVLAGFMSILSKDFIAHYKDRIINVHPSLIPSFCGQGFYGLKVHEAALAKGVKVSGATVHFVNEIPDGGKIIAQKAVEVLPGDTPEVLQKRIMENAEWILLPQAVEDISSEILRSRTMIDFVDYLKYTSYPGRGILVSKDLVYYFIMGRSSNSRNRVFTLTDDGIRTEAFDASKLEDPSLIIYHPVRKMDDKLVVTNGDQTDTIVEYKDFRKALETREYEPDAPNFTPRISAILNGDGSFEISILKHVDGKCLREFFAYEGCPEGKGYFISTYKGDGTPLPSFAGEPLEVSVPTPEEVWDALNSDNKVSLYTNVNGEVKIFNKNLGD